MDTVIGNVELTRNQVDRLYEVNGGKIKGVSYQHRTGKITAVSSEKLTEQDKADLLDSINSLSDEPIAVIETLEEKVERLDAEIKELKK